MPTNDDTDGTIPFAGLTRHNEQWTPDGVYAHGSSMRWWAAERTGDEDQPDLPATSLNTAIDRLPRATAVETGWKHPISGEWVPTEKHNAVINPATAPRVEEDYATRDDLDDDIEDLAAERGVDPDDFDGAAGDEALFYIPSSDYTIINPSQFLRPLAEVIREEDLGDDVFGEFRLHRNGGRVSADVFFNGKHVESPRLGHDRKPIVVGLQIDWDFFGGTALGAQGVGMDWQCVNAIREITDKVTIKHAGNVEERVDWHAEWRDLLEQIDLKTDQLSRLIEEATQETLDVADLPADFQRDEHDSILEAFYAYSGLPGYLAEVAAQNCRAEAADPFAPDFWEIHRGATYAISHEARGSVGTGGSIEQYNRTANDMLTNPIRVMQDVEEAYTETVEDDDTLEDEAGGTASILVTDERIQRKKQRFEEREAEIRALAAGADE